MTPSGRLSLLAILMLLLVASGCTYTGPDSHPLPFTHGGGTGATVLHVELRDASNLVPNADVKLDDVTVGSVRSIAFRGWRADLLVGIDPGVAVRRGSTAGVGQKSLLGAEYLQLTSPAAGPVLANGATIGLDRTRTTPETEDVLSAMSLLLNGGGLNNLRTIDHELLVALNGHEGDVRRLVRRLTAFLGALDDQRGRLVDVLTQMNGLAGTLAHQNGDVVAALDMIPRGMGVLERQRISLVRLLQASGRFSLVATRLMDANRAGLAANLGDLRPVLSRLADAGRELPQSLGMITFPLAADRLQYIARGDYANIFLNIDLTRQALDTGWLSGTPFAGMFARGLRLGAAAGAGPPAAIPARPRLQTPQLPRLPLPRIPQLPNLTTQQPGTGSPTNPLGQLLLGGG